MREINIGPIHLGQRPAIAPAGPDTAAAATPAVAPARRPVRRQQRGVGDTLTRVALAGTLLVAGVEGGMLYSNSQKPSTEGLGAGAAASMTPATPRSSEAAGTPRSSEAAGLQSVAPDANASIAPLESPVTLENQALGKDLVVPVPVPTDLSQLQYYIPSEAPQGVWFNPIYDKFEADQAHNWRGIGPHYPVVFDNLGDSAATLTAHNSVGELVIQAVNGGKVMIGFMQENAHQKDGAYDDKGVKGNWEMQYTFKSVPQGTTFEVIDPDTGKQMLWPDGSPVVYGPSINGDASFEIPATNGNDVRVGFIINIPAPLPGTQVPEMKIERGPNNHPELKGENPLPKAVIKPLVPGDGNK